jgi:4-hydroxy-tetrahydrodipicolinate reductase
MIRIVIAGIGGRMGREIFAAAQADPNVQIVGGTAREAAGESLQLTFGVDISIASDLSEITREFDVVVDFTTPNVTMRNAHWCADHQLRFVSGTTGFTAQQLDELRALSSQTAIFYSRNMSIGLNAILDVLPALVRSLDTYDIEIVEAHHRHKADAPSGTALALAESIAGARNQQLRDHAVFGRHGIAPRTSSEIGIHSIRAGGNAGEHTLIFGDEGEEIQVVHRALSRRTFALGAIRAAKFLARSGPGFYTMTNLLAQGT